jgi:D-amino peptidase
MRLYISADIEGIAGVVTRQQSLPPGLDYADARRWMTDSVAAAAEAAFAMRVEEVVVADSHMAGQNILIDRLPDRVQLIRGLRRPLGMVAGVEEGHFDGALFIGWHTGSTHLSGVLGHTMRSLVVREIRLNGRVVSEAGFYHPLLGHFGVPLIGISGDDQFVEETRGLAGDVEAAVVKWSYGHLSARSLTPAAAQAEIAAMTRRALGRIGDFRPHVIQGPIALEVAFKHRPPVDTLSLLPQVERLDAYTIRVMVPDMRGASNFMSVALGYDPTEQ